jgi:hypothetical protein
MFAPSTSAGLPITVLNQGTVMGEVWNDANVDGLIDNGESGINDIPVNLLYSGTIVQTTTTNTSGDYTFVGLTVGSTYSVQVDLGLDSGYAFTLEYMGGGIDDSDVSAATGDSSEFIAEGGQTMTMNAGLVPLTSNGAISGAGAVPGNSQYTYAIDLGGEVNVTWELGTYNSGQFVPIAPNLPNGPEYSSNGNGTVYNPSSNTTIGSVTVTFPNAPYDLLLEAIQNGHRWCRVYTLNHAAICLRPRARWHWRRACFVRVVSRMGIVLAGECDPDRSRWKPRLESNTGRFYPTHHTRDLVGYI